MRTLACLLINLCAAGHLLGAYPFPVILPAGSEGLVGNSSAFEPFAIGNNSIRYQQVFTPLGMPQIYGAQAFWISGMIFRQDEAAFGNYRADINFQVNLATTSRRPDGLSTLFADNVGTDDLAVFPRTTMTIVASPGHYSSPVIEFTQPFYYDTRAGNLLLDVRYFGSTPFPELTRLDAVNFPDDDTSRIWANSVGATSGTADSLGLVLGFYVTPIPEPATATLLICGAAVLGLAFRRRIHS